MSICRDIEPFLNLFQLEKSLAVFLYTKLKELIVSLLERFVKPSLLEQNLSPNKLLQIDLDDKNNLLPIKSIDVGFGGKVFLKKLTSVEKTLECQF